MLSEVEETSSFVCFHLGLFKIPCVETIWNNQAEADNPSKTSTDVITVVCSVSAHSTHCECERCAHKIPHGEDFST